MPFSIPTIQYMGLPSGIVIFPAFAPFVSEKLTSLFRPKSPFRVSSDAGLQRLSTTTVLVPIQPFCVPVLLLIPAVAATLFALTGFRSTAPVFES